MWVAAYTFFGFFFGSADAGMDRESPVEHAQPLTDAERELVRATHFGMTVAVVDPNGDLARTNSLMRDLAGTGLFDDVVALHDASDADLVVTVARSSINRGGARSFTLARMDDPNISITVNYNRLSFMTAARAGERQHDRLALEVINAVDQLMDPKADAPQ